MTTTYTQQDPSETALAVIPPAQLAVFGREQIDLIKRTVANGTSDDEFALFIEVCKRTGLDPFSHQIYAITRNSNYKGDDGRWHTRKIMTIQTGIDGYRALAARTGDLAGIEDALYDTEDADHPRWAKVTVYRWSRNQRAAFTATARWSEYAQTIKKDGATALTGKWQDMPYLMLGKCAEALALRKAFPVEISGVYTHEEMMQADSLVADVTESTSAEQRHIAASSAATARPTVRSWQALAKRAQVIPEYADFAAWKQAVQTLTGKADGASMTTADYDVVAAHVTATLNRLAAEAAAVGDDDEMEVDE